jgi:hypothetical protein
MKSYLERKEYDKIAPKSFCGTTFGGFWFCCKRHTTIRYILVFIVGIVFGVAIIHYGLLK